ncbi:hypothetical protein O6H91_19G017000 [Diphasiastrum complanatum]|uniref:Uncharacterized protein n=1 Tax=Diphasiastrum complanatum TaxID=34168 RepID=A0ACC2ATB6_DIPCM|nr:hypothetical protein O6H91_19G017000 [Diphasiastrum complanatum]
MTSANLLERHMLGVNKMKNGRSDIARASGPVQKKTIHMVHGCLLRVSKGCLEKKYHRRDEKPDCSSEDTIIVEKVWIPPCLDDHGQVDSLHVGVVLDPMVGCGFTIQACRTTGLVLCCQISSPQLLSLSSPFSIVPLKISQQNTMGYVQLIDAHYITGL